MFHVTDLEAGMLMRARRIQADADDAIDAQAAVIARLQRQLQAARLEVAAERRKTAAETARRIAAEQRLEAVYRIPGIGAEIRKRIAH